jgi:CheY-like chemotaxis protein
VSEQRTGTVLVIDDDPTNRLLLRRGLEREGLRVETAADGVEALERLARPGIDLVLLDLLMPRLNGHEVLARMRADSRLRHVPVIVVSGADETAEAVRCIELGADDFLPKPFDVDVLIERMCVQLEIETGVLA